MEFNFNPIRGKGSHGELTVDNHRTIVQHGEIAPDTLASVFRDRKINRREF